MITPNKTGIALTLLAALATSCTEPVASEGASQDPGNKADDPLEPIGPDGSPDQEKEPVLAIDASHWTKTITDPDVDCFWEQGYRHAIIGTQVVDVSRAQLEIALRGGMTVDLYVYIYWSDTVERQMQEALDLIAEFPEIGRVWIDVEEQDTNGLSVAGLEDYIQQCVDYLGGFPAGIYAGKGFWDGVMFDSQKFAELPLWYARYDNVISLETFAPGNSHHFGGWQRAVGKQFDDHSPATCGRAVDKNIFIPDTEPLLAVDRSPQADDGTPPDVLVNPWPADGLEITTSYVRPTAIPSREATGYEIALEFWNGSEFRPYWTTRRTVSDLTLFPAFPNHSYRWKIRAENSHGFGPWTDWAWFNFGVPIQPYAP